MQTAGGASGSAWLHSCHSSSCFWWRHGPFTLTWASAVFCTPPSLSLSTKFALHRYTKQQQQRQSNYRLDGALSCHHNEPSYAPLFLTFPCQSTKLPTLRWAVRKKKPITIWLVQWDWELKHDFVYHMSILTSSVVCGKGGVSNTQPKIWLPVWALNWSSIAGFPSPCFYEHFEVLHLKRVIEMAKFEKKKSCKSQKSCNTCLRWFLNYAKKS